MLCTPGLIWGQQEVEVYNAESYGIITGLLREEEIQGKLRGLWGNNGRVLLRHHMEKLHGMVLPNIRVVDFRGGGPDSYRVSFPQNIYIGGVPG